MSSWGLSEPISRDPSLGLGATLESEPLGPGSRSGAGLGTSTPSSARPSAGPQPTGPAVRLGPAPDFVSRQIGRYLTKAELGRGGAGAVYLAVDSVTQREVAIKELIVTPNVDPTALHRFEQEWRVMARISHPNIVHVFDLERQGDASYLILEYVPGESLRELINRGFLSLDRSVAILDRILIALDQAHQCGIVHRDVKPENILISRSGEVKVADFGVARLTDDAAPSSATRLGTTIGTPQYMSPEQVASSRVDGRSDLYSAGVILYELICGRPPFTAPASRGPFTVMTMHVQVPPKLPAIHRPGIDPELQALMLMALAKNPDLRFQTGSEFAEALRAVADRICPGWKTDPNFANWGAAPEGRQWFRSATAPTVTTPAAGVVDGSSPSTVWRGSGARRYLR